MACIFPTRYARCHIFKGTCSPTNCNSNWANKIHQLLLEWGIQKSLQWTPIGRTCSTHVQYDHTLVMTKSKCCFFCTQQNYKLWEMMHPTVIYSNLHTVIRVIVYCQYNFWNIWFQNSIPWLRIFLTCPVYLICINTTVRENCRFTA